MKITTAKELPARTSGVNSIHAVDGIGDVAATVPGGVAFIPEE
jgi:hypothetical protein